MALVPVFLLVLFQFDLVGPPRPAVNIHRGRSAARRPRLKDTSPRLRHTFVAELVVRPSTRGGRRECRMRGAHPQPGVQLKKSTPASHHRYRRQSDIPCTMVLTVSFVLSPAIGLRCHRHRRKLNSADLIPASRNQDHTTSPSASGAFVSPAAAS